MDEDAEDDDMVLFYDPPQKVCRSQNLSCMSLICWTDDDHSDDCYEYVDDDDGAVADLEDKDEDNEHNDEDDEMMRRGEVSSSIKACIKG